MTNANNDDDDDWGITPDFKVEMTEQEQRWGSKAVTGPGRMGYIDMNALRAHVMKDDAETKSHAVPKASYGYGGKFGVEKDRMDKSAVGSDYHIEASKHASQQDYSKGFGGRYGVQTDSQDRSAVGYDHHEAPAQHASQTDASIGFGGKFGVQTDRVDKAAQGYKTGAEQSEKGAPTKQKSFIVENASNTASGLRAKFEQMAVENKKEAERPQRPVGKLPSELFKKPPVETKAEPVHQPSPEPIPQLSVEPVRQPSPEPTPVPLVESVRQPSSESAPQPLAESVHQPSPEPIPQPSAEPVRQPSPEPVAQPTPQSTITAMALYDFTANADDELNLTAGDNITDINKFDEAWWFGKIGDREGIFPANYVSENT